MRSALLRQKEGQNVRIVLEKSNKLACPMAAPWLYRRGGVYNKHLRPAGVSKRTITLSLRTGHRETATRYRRLI